MVLEEKLLALVTAKILKKDVVSQLFVAFVGIGEGISQTLVAEPLQF